MDQISQRDRRIVERILLEWKPGKTSYPPGRVDSASRWVRTRDHDEFVEAMLKSDGQECLREHTKNKIVAAAGMDPMYQSFTEEAQLPEDVWVGTYRVLEDQPPPVPAQNEEMPWVSSLRSALEKMLDRERG